MHYYSEPRAKATTVEDFLKRGGGGNGRVPQEEPNVIEKKIRDWAEKLMQREKVMLEEAVPLVPRQHVDRLYKMKELSRQFEKIANPDLDGTVEAIRILWRYKFGLHTAQPS